MLFGKMETKPQVNNVVIKTIKLGNYYINNPNSKESIEWIILAEKGNKKLVISKYALHCQLYNKDETIVTWETCTLRRWLNEDFLSNAFSPDERRQIALSTVVADKNPEHNTKPGKDTKDRIFILSVKEANAFFASNNTRMCVPSKYCVPKTFYKEMYDGCLCWLRTPGYISSTAASLKVDGSVHHYGFKVNSDGIAVRPAMWIET